MLPLACGPGPVGPAPNPANECPPSPTHAGAGCTQCYTNGDCKACKKGYYLDALKRCQLCNMPNCETCDAIGACAACKKVRLEQLAMQPGSLLRRNKARSQGESSKMPLHLPP